MKTIIYFFIAIVLFCSCASQSGKRVPQEKSIPSFHKVKLTNSSGVSCMANIDTIFKKGDIIKINGEILAVN